MYAIIRVRFDHQPAFVPADIVPLTMPPESNPPLLTIFVEVDRSFHTQPPFIFGVVIIYGWLVHCQIIVMSGSYGVILNMEAF
jgi:hypothetical protein